jgi:hypothetical protein
MDGHEEIFWAEGICAFIDPDKMPKDKLLAFSKEMKDEFKKDRTTDWRCNREPLMTIAILEGDKMGILYSTFKTETEVSEIGDIVDTVSAMEKWEHEGDYTVYRDDFSNIED